MSEAKQCTICGINKPLSSFHKRGEVSKNGSVRYRSSCKDCNNKKALDYHNNYRKPNGIARKAAYRYTLKTLYNLSEEDFNAKWDRQVGTCAICGNKIKNPFKDNVGYKQAVDHCHSSGRVRGILCNTCNTGLGSFKDSLENLANAIKYLEKNNGDS